jgi:NAD(P)-dependent dehydrogenase (short-subunit alcohol dehydrogenase family)
MRQVGGADRQLRGELVTDLAGKVVLVTGGSRGVGEGIVRGLAKAGASVILNYTRSLDRARKIAAEIGSDRCHILGAELDQLAQLIQLWNDAVAWRGRVDVLVNNAATRPSIAMEADPLEWDAAWMKTLRVNLVAPAHLTKLAIPHFRQLGMGIVINIGSRPAFRGDRPEFFHDGASKGGLVSLTRGVARFYAKDNIFAYCVVPGMIQTEQLDEFVQHYGKSQAFDEIPMGGPGTPEDIAHWVVFLASGQVRYATGATIDVNGASYLH